MTFTHICNRKHQGWKKPQSGEKQQHTKPSVGQTTVAARQGTTSPEAQARPDTHIVLTLRSPLSFRPTKTVLTCPPTCYLSLLLSCRLLCEICFWKYGYALRVRPRDTHKTGRRSAKIPQIGENHARSSKSNKHDRRTLLSLSEEQ